MKCFWTYELMVRKQKQLERPYRISDIFHSVEKEVRKTARPCDLLLWKLLVLFDIVRCIFYNDSNQCRE